VSTDLNRIFLNIVRLGIALSDNTDSTEGWPKTEEEWNDLKVLADQQGLAAVVLDGVDKCRNNISIPAQLKLKWIGEILRCESLSSLQCVVAKDFSKLFYRNGIRTYVLKGMIVAECYPKPNHRLSVDIDCYLLPDKGVFDAWSLGNELIEKKGFRVNRDFYKNSSFEISGVNIENHQYLTPFRGNERLIALEKLFQSLLKQDDGQDVIEGTNLYRPPVMVSALFLIEHAYSHFLHEGLTWRMVLDWQMFSRRHRDKIDWTELEARVDEFGFRRFYDSFCRLGGYLVGDITVDELQLADKMMLEDIWAPLDVHETVTGLRGKFALAGNTWRARWKYRHFTDISWLRALCIQTKGFLFENNPKI